MQLHGGAVVVLLDSWEILVDQPRGWSRDLGLAYAPTRSLLQEMAQHLIWSGTAIVGSPTWAILSINVWVHVRSDIYGLVKPPMVVTRGVCLWIDPLGD
jgi:hypothetical protein